MSKPRCCFFTRNTQSYWKQNCRHSWPNYIPFRNLSPSHCWGSQFLLKTILILLISPSSMMATSAVSKLIPRILSSLCISVLIPQSDNKSVKSIQEFSDYSEPVVTASLQSEATPTVLSILRSAVWVCRPSITLPCLRRPSLPLLSRDLRRLHLYLSNIECKGST